MARIYSIIAGFVLMVGIVAGGDGIANAGRSDGARSWRRQGCRGGAVGGESADAVEQCAFPAHLHVLSQRQRMLANGR